LAYVCSETLTTGIVYKKGLDCTTIEIQNVKTLTTRIVYKKGLDCTATEILKKFCLKNPFL